jgi:uncharacterized protein YukE
MRASEFISETKVKKITKRQSQSSRGINTYKDGERASSDYTEYRLGLAVAGADGKHHLNVPAKSWHGKSKVTFPYSAEEQAMLKQAYKAVGAKYDDINHGNMNSMELEDTNRSSPVPKRKKNKYGV